MEIFLVGGAVRDELLKRPVKERDWVVVGATPEALISQNFQPVGKDFPVFLHPKTHEEYALARTERKTSKGYKGFQFYATPEVTLKEDLKRRDLTINAIAKSEKNELFDPYNGQADLKDRWLRHVSPAFSEDPVRILRIARFASTLPGFRVHPETNALMRDMVKAGEVDALVPERVWKELSRTLMTAEPQRFFDVLKEAEALPILFPELSDNQLGIDALIKSVKQGLNGRIRFAVLLHQLNTNTAKKLCKRYRIPKDYMELTILVTKHMRSIEQIDINNANSLLDLLRATDALRRPERFTDFLSACELITNHHINQPLLSALDAAKNIDTTALMEKNLKGPDIAKAIYALQLEAIKQQIVAN